MGVLDGSPFISHGLFGRLSFGKELTKAVERVPDSSLSPSRS